MVCPLVAVSLVHGCHQTAALVLFELVIFLSGICVILFPFETKGRELKDTVSSSEQINSLLWTQTNNTCAYLNTTIVYLCFHNKVLDILWIHMWIGAELGFNISGAKCSKLGLNHLNYKERFLLSKKKKISSRQMSPRGNSHFSFYSLFIVTCSVCIYRKLEINIMFCWYNVRNYLGRMSRNNGWCLLDS